MGTQTLDKKAKEMIISQVKESGVITRDKIVELIRPHYMFDKDLALERELKRKANSIISQIKDDDGTRDCFNYKNPDGESTYAYVGTTKDVRVLNQIEEQLKKKYIGLNESINKVRKRRSQLPGQISLFEKEA
ncbi:hypothetical protein GC105_09260 [Alkalibaculum sp. M08DMB]|uniref:Uncharacterized protein n=1 Tax=Alkalibaculum sporogenes TaxID=2655001 RepID=A0A6A7K927_9FIRM|nr:hypothetical protein [Alkalibaculum sporogenes]MPW25978.1 hypothetical protein [Alkalibaculum sporogenes]